MTPSKWMRIVAIAYTFLGWLVFAVENFRGSFRIASIMIVFNIFVVWYDNRYKINTHNHKIGRRIVDGIWLVLMPILMLIAVIIAARYDLNPLWN